MHTSNTSLKSLVGRWAAAAALAAIATGAMAQVNVSSAAEAAATNALAAQQQQRLNIAQIYDAVAKAGYTHVKEIEWSHGGYEVDARNPQGERVELRVDGQTGAVLRSRYDD